MGDEKKIERPPECGLCKKPAKYLYKEMEDKVCSELEMCSDCPVFKQKLYGDLSQTPPEEREALGTGLFCGHCHTPLEAIKMGNPMGCASCYAVFSDKLIGELIEEDKIPKDAQKALRNQPLHMGKTPDNPMQIPESNKLTSLNEALNEALSKENYEEAAWLRDQITELMEGKDDKPE